MFKVGQLVWILSSDESGDIMPNQSPVLIVAKYVGIPRAFICSDEANEKLIGSQKKTVYDILCEGIIEYAVDEDWLSVLSDEDVKRFVDE